MPAVIPLKCRFSAHWKLRIHDLEEREPPHVTIYGQGDSWRWNLREKKFMDKRPPHHRVPVEIIEELIERWSELAGHWNLIHKSNPVEIKKDEN